MFFRKKAQTSSPGSVVTSDSLHNEKLKSDIILSSIEDGVVLIDSEGLIRSFNPGAEKITGWFTKDAVNLSYSSVLKFVDKFGEKYPEPQNPINRVFKEAQIVRNNEVELLTASGKHIAIFISSSPLLDQDGRVQGLVTVFRDVSKERNEESQRAEFISTASHEMRTPVAAIEGYLALVMNDAVCKIDTKAREYLDKAHSSTQHLGKLFQDLLTAAKSEDGRLMNHPEVVDMTAFTQEVAEGVKFTAEKKGLVTEFLLGSNKSSSDPDSSPAEGGTKILSPLYYAHIDPDRMREVVINIFDNAVKYTDQGKITIALTGNEKIIQLSVSDTGPGIPAEDIQHLFQKFYRVDNSSTRTVGGTGLGLFICRKIVELYGGRIWAESKVGSGSTFYINIPRMSTSQAQQMMSEALSVESASKI